MAKKYLDFEGLSHFKGKLDGELAKKVDKVEGKGLSTNDYTNEEKEAVQQAVEQASNVNVELEGSVVKITDKDGNEEEIDLLDATSERVYVNVTTNKEDQSVEGLVINCFLNNDVDEPLQATTNANGQCYFDVPNNYHYKLVFPTIAGCDPITDVTHIAHASQRIVDVEYKETFIPTSGESVLIILQEKDGNSFYKLVNKTVTVTYNGKSTDYTTDSRGMVDNVIIPFNTLYSVTFPKFDGYYIQGGRYTQEHTADKSSRSLIMTYYSFQSGVFIVSDEGQDYNEEEWIASGLPNNKAVAIKIATTDLQDHGGVFAVDIDYIVNTGPRPTAQLKAFMSSSQWITNIPENGNNVNADYYFDGHTASELIKVNLFDRGLLSPALDAVRSMTLTVAGVVYNGFIGSLGQWSILWSKTAEINSIITTVRPDYTYRISDYTGDKWTSTQSSEQMMYAWRTALNGRAKNTSFDYMPFFKIS